jgi:CheY-like chemotaxis protein
MVDSQRMVLVIDDDQDQLDDLEKILNGLSFGSGEQLKVVLHDSFESSVGVLNERWIDVVVLDLRDDRRPAKAGEAEAGERVFEQILARRFVPIVVYTALTGSLSPDISASPFVRVVRKGVKGAEELKAALGELLSTRLPEVHRLLMSHAEQVQREYLLGFVKDHWKEHFRGEERLTHVVHALARRLAGSLTGEALNLSLKELRLPTLEDRATEPAHVYVRPPIRVGLSFGDLYLDDKQEWWAVVTPSCDLVVRDGSNPKCERPLLAACIRWDSKKEVEARIGGTAKDRQTRVLTNNHERFHFLPAALGLPDLVIDFQDLRTVDWKWFESATGQATVDSPFAEEIQSRMARFLGRIGTPDLDRDYLASKIW